MRLGRYAFALVALLALALASTGCGSPASPQATGELIADERPVPPGMPVMYEFFTTT